MLHHCDRGMYEICGVNMVGNTLLPIWKPIAGLMCEGTDYRTLTVHDVVTDRLPLHLQPKHQFLTSWLHGCCNHVHRGAAKVGNALGRVCILIGSVLGNTREIPGLHNEKQISTLSCPCSLCKLHPKTV
jgi:hypothetical protein